MTLSAFDYYLIGINIVGFILYVINTWLSPTGSGAADETGSRRQAFPAPYGTHPALYRW